MALSTMLFDLALRGLARLRQDATLSAVDVLLVGRGCRRWLQDVFGLAEQRVVVVLRRRAVHRYIIDENLVVSGPRSYGRAGALV